MRALRASVAAASDREGAERKHKLNRILRTWRHTHTSRAFDGWRDLTKHNRDLLNRSARHWRSALVSSVWRRWREMVAETAKQRGAVAAAVGRMRSRLAAAAFLAWRDNVRWAVDTRRERLQKTVGRWANRALAMTFMPWAALTLRSRKAKELQRRAMMRLTHGLISSILWAWAEHVAATLQHRHDLLQRATLRAANRPAAIALQAWIDFTQERVAAREQMHLKAARRFTNHLAAMTFEAWKTYLEWKTTFLRQVLVRSTLLGACWRTWFSHVAGRRLHARTAAVRE